jgi:hypothetical protein
MGNDINGLGRGIIWDTNPKFASTAKDRKNFGQNIQFPDRSLKKGPEGCTGGLSISSRLPGRRRYVDMGRRHVYVMLNVLNPRKIRVIIIIIIIIIIMNIRKYKSLTIEIKAW